MEAIITRGYYWRKSKRVWIPDGTPIIAMGGHGGRGLYLLGISTGQWENETGDGDYGQRIPVRWQPVVYCHPAASVNTVIDMIDSGFSIYSGGEVTQKEFRKVLNFVLKGDVLDYSVDLSAAA
jgi:hypothetical protein